MPRVRFRLTARQDSIFNSKLQLRNIVFGALCLFAFSFVVGCVNKSSFTDNATNALPYLQSTQNPTPIDPANHIYGPTNTIAFGQIYRPTTVLDPKTLESQSGSFETKNSNQPN
jgi:ABC-type oligopeptide transport system substrate-binding subunit